MMHSLTIRLNDEDFQKIADQAKRSERSIAGLTRLLLRRAMNKGDTDA